MSKSTVSLICLIVAANLCSIDRPTMAAIEISHPLLTPNNSSLDRAASESSNKLEDPILEEIGLNRVDKLKQFINSGGSSDRYFHAAINAGSIVLRHG